MMTERKILQIIPASGWRAVFKDEPENTTTPVVCWALIEETDQGEVFRYVVGLDACGTVDFCDAMTNFVGYEQEPL